MDKNRPRAKVQLKPSKWPLRIRSPIGEGARRGFSATVAERRGFVVKGAPLAVGLTAVLGGGLGGELGSNGDFAAKAALLNESLRKRPVPRSWQASGIAVGGG
jgi:hypothetical protein